MTAALPAHADVRDCRLYRFRVYHPHDMHLPPDQRRIVLGYVGETARMPLARLLEHIQNQPWADTIVGWDLDPRVFAGKQAVLAAEAAAIEREKPLYNVIGNERNRRRITPPDAMRQRRARDAAKPVGQRWVHPDDRGGPARVSSRTAKRPRVRRRKLPPWQRKLLDLVAAWAVMTAGVWFLFAHYEVIPGWRVQGFVAGLGSLIWVLLLWSQTRPRRRRR